MLSNYCEPDNDFPLYLRRSHSIIDTQFPKLLDYNSLSVRVMITFLANVYRLC